MSAASPGPMRGNGSPGSGPHPAEKHGLSLSSNDNRTFVQFLAQTSQMGCLKSDRYGLHLPRFLSAKCGDWRARQFVSGAASPSAAPRRMSCSEISIASSPNSASTARKITDAGDDRRRPVRVQAAARAGARPGSSRPARRGSGRSRRRVEQVAVDALGVVGIKLLGDRSQRGGGAGDRDRVPTLRRRRSSGTASATIRAHIGAQLVQLGRGRRVVCRWRSVWRTTPACVETWNSTSLPAPMTSSVEPPPMSSTSVGVTSSGSRSLVAPRKVRRASSSPDSTCGSRP